MYLRFRWVYDRLVHPVRLHRGRWVHLSLCVAVLTLGVVATAAQAQTGEITTVAGTGVAGFAGDGGPAGAAQLSIPVAVTATPDGGYLIAEQGTSRVRRVASDGTITTVAGSGVAGFAGDGGPATAARLSAPSAAALTTAGDVLIADANNNRIRSVSPGGTITTVAGTGAAAFGGDGGPATAAQIRFPADVAVTSDGGYLIADNDNHRIRKVSAGGTITTVAGNGAPGFGGEGGAATAAQINDPAGVAPTPDGGFAIADLNNQRVRLVAAGGTITTIAGTGAAGFSGDGGAATAAQLNGPTRVAVTRAGAVLVADRFNHRLREIQPGGAITTLAGTGTAGFSGDGGAATVAQVNGPLGVAVTAGGDVLLGDTFNHRVRLIDTAGEPGPAPDRPAPGPAPGPSRAPDRPPVLPPDARVAASIPTRVLGRATLDASASRGAFKYLWDLNSDGRTDAQCGASQPKLTIRPLGAKTQNVTLTVIGATGLKSFAKTLLSSPKVAAKPLSRAATDLSAVRVCSGISKFIDQAIDLTLGGGPPAGCTTTVTSALLSAVGCLDRATKPEEVPAGEKGTIDRLVKAFNDNPPVRELVRSYCVASLDCPPRRAALIEATDLYYSRKTVRVNGLDVEPRRGGAVIVHPQLERVISSNATVRLGDATLKTGEVNLDLSGRSGQRVKLAVGSFTGIKRLPSLGGFLPTGELDISLTADSGRRSDLAVAFSLGPFYENHRTEATLMLRLPKSVFSLFGGQPPSGRTVASATNERGLILDALSISAPQANIGGVRLTDLKFDYLRQDRSKPCEGRSSFKGGGNLLFGPEGDAGFRFSPPPSENGIGFCDSSLSNLGGRFVFGAPGPPAPPIFPGVTLKEIGLSFGFEPTRLRGDAKLAVAEITEVKGTLLAVFASPEEPYTLSDADAGGTLARLPRRYFETTAFAVGGKVSITARGIGKIDLGSGYFLYAVPDYVALGGTMRADIPGGHVQGSADGELGIRRRAFNLQVSGEACTVLCYGGTVLVSSVGVAACGKVNVKIPPFKNPFGQIEVTWTPGIGWRYGEFPPTIYLNGCDVKPFRAQVAAAAADGSRTFTMRSSVPHQLVRLTGRDGAPSVEVRGPGGEAVSTALADIDGKGTIRILRSKATRATFIDVSKPGAYTVTPLEGSPPIASMATAEGLPPASVKAPVKGSGDRRTLSYDVAPRPGQKVTFVEKGPTTNRVIGSVAAGKGTLRFTPGEGQSGARQIVARIELGGLVKEEKVVARYKVGPPPKPGRPGRVRVRRKGTALTVSWAAAKGVARYGLVVTPRGGVQKILTLPAKRLTKRVTGIPATQAGTVVVRALTEAGDAGPPASARFSATKKARSRFLPFSELARK